MRAIRFARTGGPEVLELVEVETPRPGPGKVLIRQQAIGINFIDTYHRTGLYPMPLPMIPGREGAGVVEAVGEGVTRFRPGDMVGHVLTNVGAYAEFAAIPAGRVVGLPPGVSPKIAAASLLKGLTVEALLRRCYPVRAGETILVHAAAGGVGQIMVQWAKALGATVIATVGSAAKADTVRALGADHVILYQEQDVAAQVRRMTGGEGVPVAYDSVGLSTFQGTMDSLARRGLFVNFGNASGRAPDVSPARLSMGSLFFTRMSVSDYIVTTEELDRAAADLFGMIASGKVKVEVGQTYPLAEAARAHKDLEARRTQGSSLLIP